MKCKNKLILLMIVGLVFSVVIPVGAEGDGDVYNPEGDITIKKPKDTMETPTDKKNQAQGHDPIDLKEGNFDYDVVDFKVPGRGLNAVFKRSYDSADLYNGPFGPGWNFSYNSQLIRIPDQNNDKQALIIIRYGNADRRKFREEKKNGQYQITTLSEEFAGQLKRQEDGSYFVEEKNGGKQVFDQQGNLAKLVDRNGNQIEFSYDSSDRLDYIVDSAERKYDITYNSQGKIASITDPAGRTFNYEYDQQERLVKFIEPNGAETEYHYQEDSSLLTKIVDPKGTTRLTNTYEPQSDVDQERVVEQFYNGGTAKITYGKDGYRKLVDRAGNVTEQWLTEDGRPLEIKNAAGNKIEYDYNEAGNVTSIKNPKGDTTNFKYDEDQNLVEITNPLEQSMNLEYNKFGEPTSQTDLTGDKQVEYIYDDKGNISKIKTASGITTDYEVNQYGQVTKATNNNGDTYHYQYDQYGYLKRVIDPKDNATTYQYDVLGRLTSVTDAKGRTTEYEYSYYGRKKVIDPKGNETTYEYDKNGNLTAVTNALGNTTEYKYDKWDRLRKVINPLDNTVVEYSYNANGKKTKVVDAEGKTTEYQYDELGRVKEIIDPKGNEVQYTYDELGNLTKFTDKKGNTYTYSYDKLGRKVKETNPLGQEKTYSYNENGLVEQVTEPDGDIVKYSYDSYNRLRKIDYPNQSTKSYGYDNLGRLITISQGKDILTFNYNKLGQVSRVVDSQNRKVNYSYDAVGNRTTLKLPNGQTFNYDYNKLNQLTHIQTPNGDQFTYQYNAVGQKTKLTYPNDREATYDYDAAGRLTKLNNGINSYSYNYDPTSNIKSIAGPNGTREYNYDKLDRLTGVSYPDGESINYSYDAMDNRVEKTTADGTTEYSYNALNQLTSAGDISYEYDAEGKLIKKETSNNVFDYQYNAYDRLAKVQKDGTEIASYQYDLRGKRVSVTEEGDTTEYLWQGNSLLASYVNGSREKLYATGRGMDEVLGVYGDKTSYLHANHLGSIKGITDVDGSVNGTKSYTPYGVARETTGSFNTDLGFIGRRQSDVTGLTYIRARYYDASAGRFTKIDPIKDGLNWYGYVGGNPVNYVDRTGKFKICPEVLSGFNEALDIVKTWMTIDGVQEQGDLTHDYRYTKMTRGVLFSDSLDIKDKRQLLKGLPQKTTTKYIKGAEPGSMEANTHFDVSIKDVSELEERLSKDPVHNPERYEIYRRAYKSSTARGMRNINEEL